MPETALEAHHHQNGSAGGVGSGPSKQYTGRSVWTYLLGFLFVALTLLFLGTTMIWFATKDLSFTKDELLIVYSASPPENETFTILPTDGPEWESVSASFRVLPKTTTSKRMEQEFLPSKESEEVDFSEAVPQPLCEMVPKNNDNEEHCVKGEFISSNKEYWMSSAANVSSIHQWLNPVEYSLNISILELEDQVMTGSLEILIEFRKNSNLIVLHASKHIRFIDSGRVSVWSCTEGSFICVESLTRVLDQGILIVELAATQKIGTIVLLNLNRFESEMSVKNNGLVFRVPSRWERDRLVILGTQFSITGPGTSTLFPSVDHTPERSIFRFCIRTKSGLIIRSNTESQSRSATFRDAAEGEGSEELVETCFGSTPPIPSEQFGFVLLNNVKALEGSRVLRETTVSMEVLVGSHLPIDEYNWVLEKTTKTLRLMGQVTGVDYPLPRITIISSPLAGSADAVNNLGLVQIKESWIEYPRFVQTHQILVQQLIQQWMSSTVLFCDDCIQRGLTQYLEWLISAEFMQSSESSKSSNEQQKSGRVEIQRRFFAVRRRILHPAENIRSRLPLSVASNANKAGEEGAAAKCQDRISLGFFTLEDTYGREAIVEFISSIFRRFKWRRCVLVEELSHLFGRAAKSEEAKRMFESLIISEFNGTGKQAPHVEVNLPGNGSLIIGRRIDSAVSKEESEPKKVSSVLIPVKLIDDLGKRSRILLNESGQIMEKVVSYVVAEPIPYARFTYNVENYMKLFNCFDNGSSHSSNCVPEIDEEVLQNAVRDLCWALLSNQLRMASVGEAPKWRSLFDRLSESGVVDGGCSCCMQRKQKAEARCRWTWNDKCSNISILNATA